MLQPSSPPDHRASPQGLSIPEEGDRVGGGGGGGRRAPASLWRWISLRELVFIFVACSVGAALFRSRDNVRFEPTWIRELDTSYYQNRQFPLEDERLPPPIVTDLDSDGTTDLLYLTPDHRLVLETFPDTVLSQSTHRQPRQMASVNIKELSGGSHAVAIATGYLRQFQSMVQIRQQVIAVLTSDWTVLNLNHELKLMWKVQPIKEEMNTLIKEPSILISYVSIQKGDTGCLIVGGRAMQEQVRTDSFSRARRGGTPEDLDALLNSMEHYTTVALDGGSGETRWTHTPADFTISPAYPPDISPFHHLKLVVHKQLPHVGEVSWHQYSNALRSVLPHSWQRDRDTHFQLSHFKKDRKKGEQPDISEHVKTVGGLAADHIAGLTFGGLRPHSPTEHIQDPNVLIIHSAKGVDVLHLYQGRPLCSISLSPFHSTHADVNGDGTIDHVQAVVNPTADTEDDPSCYGQANPMAHSSKPIFTHSICKAVHWTETFFSTDKWLPALNKRGRKNVDHTITEPLAPILVKSTYHSSPLKLHLSEDSLTKWLLKREKTTPPAPPRPLSQHPILYDSVFVLSSGRVTSVGPRGEFNWQVDVKADWDPASEVIYNPDHESWNQNPEHVTFVHQSFTPSALPYQLHSFGETNHIMVTGWERLALVTTEDVAIATILRLPCQPVAPPLVADFSDDGYNDIILTCRDQYAGYVLTRQSGFLHTTVLSLFVGVVIVIIAIYTRQKHISLLPAMKPSQD